tara:strand:+ start:785 stop:1132 length:348 start_codon:yes stop_codon:yes gene_type:complete
MKVLVCGGRDYHDYERVKGALNSLNKKHGIELIIEGGANGADAHAAVWAKNNAIQGCSFHACWDTLGKKAGPIRNKNMLNFGSPDCVVAFKGGAGTQGMVAMAKRFGINVWEVKP